MIGASGGGTSLGVALAWFDATLVPMAFSARTRKKYSVSLVRPVTVKPVAFAPPGALFAMSVQSVAAQVAVALSFWQYSCSVTALRPSEADAVQPSVTRS